MRHGVSIIHGARRIRRSKNYPPQWPNRLSRFLRLDGFDPVIPFFWTGSVLDILSTKIARSYANHLCRLLTQYDTGNSQCISIIAKSAGAIIAERALKFLPECINSTIGVNSISSFIRIAVPDVRKTLHTPYIRNVINIVSNNDILYKASILPLTAMITILGLNVRGGRHFKTYTLEGIRHGDFNKNIKIPSSNFFQGTLYEFYVKILNAS